MGFRGLSGLGLPVWDVGLRDNVISLPRDKPIMGPLVLVSMDTRRFEALSLT